MKALVTGTSSGIGLAIASHLLEQHQDLEMIGLSRRPGALESHPRFSHWETDLSQPRLAQSRARRFRETSSSCELLVCAAGTAGFTPTDGWSAEQLERLLAINLNSPIMLCSEMLPAVRKAKGLIVLVGSTASRERAPLGAAYAATKAGLHRFAEYLFAENRKSGVRVLHLCPGMTDTPFYESERFEPATEECALSPQSLAELVAFFFRGPGRHSNPTHLVVEPQRVGVRKKP